MERKEEGALRGLKEKKLLKKEKLKRKAMNDE
jgi:hypothetical protein